MSVLDPIFSGKLQAHAKIVDLQTGDTVAETDVVLEGQAAWILDQVGNMMVVAPLGEPGTGTTPFAQAWIDATGGASGQGPIKAYLLGLSLDGGQHYDSWKLIERPQRTLDPARMVITESGNDIWSIYTNNYIPRLTMRNVRFGDAVNGQLGQIAAEPFLTVPLGYQEGAGIISDGGLLPGAQGLLTYQPLAARGWAGADLVTFTGVIDQGTTTTIAGGPAQDLTQLVVSLDSNHDTIGKALDTLMKALAGVEGSNYRGHYVADPSDAALNSTGVARGVNIGGIPDSGLTFQTTGNAAWTSDAEDSGDGDSTARIVKALAIAPQLDQRYWACSIQGGTSNAELPDGATITAVACIPPNLPLFAVYVNPGQGGIYTHLGDDRATRVSPQFGVHDMQVRHTTQTVYAATDGGVYSATTIPANLLGGQTWSRVGGLLGSVQKLQLVGQFTSQWTTIVQAPAINRPTIPANAGATYQALYAFYPGDTSAFYSQVQQDSRFSQVSGLSAAQIASTYGVDEATAAAVLTAGGTFYVGQLPTPPTPTEITSPPPPTPPVSPSIPPIVTTTHAKQVTNAVFALVSGSEGGDGLYLYPGVQDQTLAGAGVLGGNLTYDAAGQLTGVDYSDAISSLSGHAGWDKLVPGTIADFGAMYDGTIIWIEQQGATQIFRTNGISTEIVFMPAGTGVGKILTSPAVRGAWIVPSGGLQALYFLPPGLGATLVPLDTDTSLNQPAGIPVAVTGLTSIKDTVNGQYVDNIVLTSTGFFWNDQPSGGGWRLGTGQGGLETTNIVYLVTGGKMTMSDDDAITLFPMYATDGQAFYSSNNGGINWRALGGESLNMGPAFFDLYRATYGQPPPYNPITTSVTTIPLDDLNAANPGSHYQIARRLDSYYQWVYTIEETTSSAVYTYTQAVSNLSTDQNVTATLASAQLLSVNKRWLVEHQKPITQLTITSVFDTPTHKLRTVRPMMKVKVNCTGLIPNDQGSITYVDYQDQEFYVLSHSWHYGGQSDGAAVSTTTVSSELQKDRLTTDQMVADLVQLSKDIVLRQGK